VVRRRTGQPTTAGTPPYCRRFLGSKEEHHRVSS